MNGILAKKLGMTQVFTEQGECVPVTVLEAGPCVVVCHKTEEKDGYTAVQIGFGLKKEQRANKAEVGHFKKADVAVREHLAEFDVADLESWPVGKEFGAADFADAKTVNVSGISKGHGFSGTIKRHGFHSGLALSSATVSIAVLVPMVRTICANRVVRPLTPIRVVFSRVSVWLVNTATRK